MMTKEEGTSIGMHLLKNRHVSLLLWIPYRSRLLLRRSIWSFVPVSLYNFPNIAPFVLSYIHKATRHPELKKELFVAKPQTFELDSYYVWMYEVRSTSLLIVFGEIMEKSCPPFFCRSHWSAFRPPRASRICWPLLSSWLVSAWPCFLSGQPPLKLLSGTWFPRRLREDWGFVLLTCRLHSSIFPCLDWSFIPFLPGTFQWPSCWSCSALHFCVSSFFSSAGFWATSFGLPLPFRPRYIGIVDDFPSRTGFYQISTTTTLRLKSHSLRSIHSSRLGKGNSLTE